MMSNDFASFSTLPEELQEEAIREGEARLQAQFAAATAADQRALTWTGLLIAAATGALGGGLALLGKSPPDYLLGIVALSFASGMLRASWIAIKTVQPNRFSMPGNTPSAWLPGLWDCEGTHRKKVQQARREQAEQISWCIKKNARRAKVRANHMRASFKMTRRTLVGGTIALGLILVCRWLSAYAHFVESVFKS